ncbi:MAG: 50S ribosomal protein L1 [Chloroflexota bacterium]
MAKRGKKYLDVLKLVDRGRTYLPLEAVRLVKQTARANFDETVEVHIRTNLDPRHADQQLRGAVVLPHGLGKPVRILVFTQGEGERIAREAGADYVGLDDLIQKIREGWLDFDVAIATMDVMGKVSQLGRILGPRGLMPNPRTGTAVQVDDLARAVRDARKGRVEFRLDRSGNVHIPLGRVSFTEEQLLENLAAVIDAVVQARPPGAKGQFIRSVTLCTTMGPGIKLDVPATLALPKAA